MHVHRAGGPRGPRDPRRGARRVRQVRVLTLTPRARNRALLARQLLLRREPLAPLRVVERLVGLQAQTPRSPYTALWSRIDGFDPMTLSRAVAERKCVRIALMRSTIHLVTARDAMALRPLIEPVLQRELANPTFRVPLDGVDLDALSQHARALLDERPRTPKQLGEALQQFFPGREGRALAHAARTVLPLVQIPPRGLWDDSGATTLAVADTWLRRSVDPDPSWDAVALRYLRAFGPAAAADLVAWSRITGLAPVLERLRPRLTVLHDPDGRELFDVPRAPRPPGDTAAPPRFLPDYDNVLLAHADRSFVFPDDVRQAMRTPNGALPGTVLVDGSVAATWSVQRSAGRTRLAIEPFTLPRAAHDPVVAEGERLLAFLAPDSSGLVEIVAQR